MAEYAEAVATIRGGAIDRLASEALAKVVAAVRATDGAASLTVKIIIKPMKDGDGELNVDGEIGITLPKVKVPTAIFYATDDNKLIRTDPRQMTMLNEGNDRGSSRPEGDINRIGRGSVTVIDGEARRA
jgi:hypothetical protein